MARNRGREAISYILFSVVADRSVDHSAQDSGRLQAFRDKLPHNHHQKGWVAFRLKQPRVFLARSWLISPYYSSAYRRKRTWQVAEGDGGIAIVAINTFCR